MKEHLAKILTIGLFAMILLSCQESKTQTKYEPEVLLCVGDSSLTLDYVVSQIPLGLNAEDSVKMFNNIVDSWLEEMMISGIAEENIVDIDKIDKMVSDYRRKLITMQYLENTRKGGDREISDDEISNYYKSNSDEMRLEHPILTGIYVKVPENTDNIEDVRKWVSDGSRKSIDNLEKYGIKEAIQYDNFEDRWVDWQLIASQIPYRFTNADDFLASNKFFETTHNGSTYFLHVYKYLKTGDVIPLSFARPQIEEILLTQRQYENERKMVAKIFNNGVREGKIKLVGFNPVTHKRINNENKNKPQ